MVDDCVSGDTVGAELLWPDKKLAWQRAYGACYLLYMLSVLHSVNDTAGVWYLMRYAIFVN